MYYYKSKGMHHNAYNFSSIIRAIPGGNCMVLDTHQFIFFIMICLNWMST